MSTIIISLIALAFVVLFFYEAHSYDKKNNKEAKELNSISCGKYRLRGPEIHKFRKEYPNWESLTKYEKSELVKEHYAG